MSSAAVEAKNIIKIYHMGETELQALKGVTITIAKGELLAITGTSGSGKSTLMHILGCLDVPSKGDLFIDGCNVAHMNRDQLAYVRNTKIGFVFQRFHLLSDLNAIDNIALPQLYAGIDEETARKNARDFLKIVGLEDRAHHYPYQLSGGQQQRVAVARALVNKPSIIFADEPTGNLDSKTGEIIIDLFKRLNKEQQITIVIVTHEQRLAEQTNRIINLIDGNIASDRQVAGKAL